MKNCCKFEKDVYVIYKNMDGLIRNLDKKIKRQALVSFGVANVIFSIDLVACLVQKKLTLLEYKRRLDLLFSRLSTKEIRCLRLKFVAPKAELDKIEKDRKYYRETSEAVETFSFYLDAVGITETDFYRDCKMFSNYFQCAKNIAFAPCETSLKKGA